MSFLSILSAAIGIPVDVIRRVIGAGVKALPDLGTAGDDLLAKVDEAVDINELLTKLPAEAQEIAKLHFAGKRHPGDVAG